MTPDARQLLDEALQLPERERAELAAKLIESLDEGEAKDTAEAVEAAWAQEIERRCAALDSGEATTSDWLEVRGRIEREILGRR